MSMAAYERSHRAFLAEVQLRHAWQFRTGDGDAAEAEVSVGPGWYPLLRRLFSEVDDCLPREGRAAFHWRGIRELGGMLAITHGGDQAAVQPAVSAAEVRACEVCHACGGPGMLRQVDGAYAVECRLHFVERLLGLWLPDDRAVRVWLTTPCPELDGLSPREALNSGHAADRVLTDALEGAMPPPPRLTWRHRQRLAAVWPAAAARLDGRLHDLRLAEFGRDRRTGTLLVIAEQPRPETDSRRMIETLDAHGFTDLRPQLLPPRDVLSPLAAPDPWLAMLAQRSSVSLAAMLPEHGPPLQA